MNAIASIFGNVVGSKIVDSIFGGSKPETEVTMAAGPFDYLQQKKIWTSGGGFKY